MIKPNLSPGLFVVFALICSFAFTNAVYADKSAYIKKISDAPAFDELTPIQTFLKKKNYFLNGFNRIIIRIARNPANTKNETLMKPLTEFEFLLGLKLHKNEHPLMDAKERAVIIRLRNNHELLEKFEIVSQILKNPEKAKQRIEQKFDKNLKKTMETFIASISGFFPSKNMDIGLPSEIAKKNNLQDNKFALSVVAVTHTQYKRIIIELSKKAKNAFGKAVTILENAEEVFIADESAVMADEIKKISELRYNFEALVKEMKKKSPNKVFSDLIVKKIDSSTSILINYPDAKPAYQIKIIKDYTEMIKKCEDTLVEFAKKMGKYAKPISSIDILKDKVEKLSFSIKDKLLKPINSQDASAVLKQMNIQYNKIIKLEAYIRKMDKNIIINTDEKSAQNIFDLLRKLKKQALRKLKIAAKYHYDILGPKTIPLSYEPVEIKKGVPHKSKPPPPNKPEISLKYKTNVPPVMMIKNKGNLTPKELPDDVKLTQTAKTRFAEMTEEIDKKLAAKSIRKTSVAMFSRILTKAVEGVAAVWIILETIDKIKPVHKQLISLNKTLESDTGRYRKSIELVKEYKGSYLAGTYDWQNYMGPLHFIENYKQNLPKDRLIYFFCSCSFTDLLKLKNKTPELLKKMMKNYGVSPQILLYIAETKLEQYAKCTGIRKGECQSADYEFKKFEETIF